MFKVFQRKPRRSNERRPTRRLCLELLEDRSVPAVVAGASVGESLFTITSPTLTGPPPAAITIDPQGGSFPDTPGVPVFVFFQNTVGGGADTGNTAMAQYQGTSDAGNGNVTLEQLKFWGGDLNETLLSTTTVEIAPQTAAAAGAGVPVTTTTINVDSTAGFLPTGYLHVLSSGGGNPVSIQYGGIQGNQFVNCTLAAGSDTESINAGTLIYQSSVPHMTPGSTLSTNLTAGVPVIGGNQTITVENTFGFQAATAANPGYLLITTTTGTDLVSYTGMTNTTFTGCTLVTGNATDVIPQQAPVQASANGPIEFSFTKNNDLAMPIYLAMFGDDPSGTHGYFGPTSGDSLDGATIQFTSYATNLPTYVPNYQLFAASDPQGTVTTFSVPNTPSSRINAARFLFSLGVKSTIPALTTGSSAPSPGNATDPNNYVNYDFLEFTQRSSPNDGALFVNTTQVDAVGLPFTMNVMPRSFGKGPGVGVVVAREDLAGAFDTYLGTNLAAPSAAELTAFENLAGDFRLLSPKDRISLGTSTDATALGSYFDDALTKFFQTYNVSGTNLTVDVNGTTYTGHVETGHVLAGEQYTVMAFTGGAQTYYVYAPYFSTNGGYPAGFPNSTADAAPPAPSWFQVQSQTFTETAGMMVFSNDGVFNDGAGQFPGDATSAGIVSAIEDALVSAFNRGVANETVTAGTPINTIWDDNTTYYKPALADGTNNANYYAGFLHNGTFNGNLVTVARPDTDPPVGLAYGFAYDDQGGNDPTLVSSLPTNVDVVLGALSLTHTLTATSAGPFTGDVPYTLTSNTPNQTLNIVVLELDANGFVLSSTPQGTVTTNGSGSATGTVPLGAGANHAVTFSSQDGGQYAILDVTAPSYTPPPNQFATANVSKSFQIGSFSDPNTVHDWTVTVDWGDSSPDDQFVVTSQGMLPDRAHAYPRKGTFTVTVTIDDGVQHIGGTFQISTLETSYATGAGAGGEPNVKVYNNDGTVHFSFNAYSPGFPGGVNVAMADVNGDGVNDIITGAGPGGAPHVRAFDGVTLDPLLSFYAFSSGFGGGVFVAAGDFNDDGKADVIASAGAGGLPQVSVFDGLTGQLLHSFLAYDPGFPGGVYVAATDINADDHADIVTGAGAGGVPHLRTWDAVTGAPLNSFYAFEPGFPGGVPVAATGTNIIAAAGASGYSQVKIYDGTTFAIVQNFNAYDLGFRGGSFVAGVAAANGHHLLLDAPAAADPSVVNITADDVKPIVDEALRIFSDLGVDSLAIDRLARINVQVADLAGNTLGTSYRNRIVLDVNAAGHGWDLDGPVARSKADLLSVVMHEFGHELGLDHDDDFMAAYLGLGQRRLPTIDDLQK